MLSRYRATGADLPFGRPLSGHGVRMEGYFWRLTLPDADQVVIALNGVNRAADGSWATLGLAALRGGFVRTVAHPSAWADPDTFGADAGAAFHADLSHLRVDLGPGARLDVRITDQVRWPRRLFGGSSYFHVQRAGGLRRLRRRDRHRGPTEHRGHRRRRVAAGRHPAPVGEPGQLPGSGRGG